jgi:hypothetical protein
MVFGMGYLLLPPYVGRTLVDHRLTENGREGKMRDSGISETRFEITDVPGRERSERDRLRADFDRLGPERGHRR